MLEGSRVPVRRAITEVVAPNSTDQAQGTHSKDRMQQDTSCPQLQKKVGLRGKVCPDEVATKIDVEFVVKFDVNELSSKLCFR